MSILNNIQPDSANRVGAHQWKLKNSKHMFDQLHRSQVQTYIVKKQHLLQNQDDNNGSSAIQKQKNITIKSKSLQRKQEIIASMSTHMNLSVNVNKQKIDNLQIIKKMLEINSVSNAAKQKMMTGYNDIKYTKIRRSSLENNEDKTNNNIFENIAQNRLQNKYRIKRRSKFENTKRQETSRINSRFSEQRKNQSNQSIRVFNNYSQRKQKNKRQNQDQQNNNRFLSKAKTVTRPIHSKSTFSQTSNSSLLQNISNLSLQSYITFISSPANIKQLYISFNFNTLRKLKSNQAWRQLDLQNAKTTENLLACIIESLRKQQNRRQRTSVHASDENYLNFVKDCCRLYFSNYEKSKMEVILKQHYFKMYAFKLNPIFVYQRIALYICYLLCDRSIRSNKQIQLMILMVLSLRNIYSLMINVITQTQLMSPTIQTVGSAYQGQDKILMEGTFQILRVVSQIQKHALQLQKNVHNFIQSITYEQQTNKDIWDIFRILKPFLNQQGYGIGNKSYQNFIKTQMLLSWKYLRVPPTPYLPPKKNNYAYTVVLDLDQTLVYFNAESNILKFRPFLEIFLNALKELNFEIISFSASAKPYADMIIKELEHKFKIFQYRLYREHLTLFQGRLVKDIRRLGRDIKNTIIIDDLKANFSSCMDNGIQVTSWQGEKSDNQLLSILNILRKLKKEQNTQDQSKNTQNKTIDLRNFIKSHKKQCQQMLQINIQ